MKRKRESIEVQGCELSILLHSNSDNYDELKEIAKECKGVIVGIRNGIKQDGMREEGDVMGVEFSYDLVPMDYQKYDHTVICKINKVITSSTPNLMWYTKNAFSSFIGSNKHIKNALRHHLVTVNNTNTATAQKLLRNNDILSIFIKSSDKGKLSLPFNDEDAAKFRVEYEDKHCAVIIKPENFYAEFGGREPNVHPSLKFNLIASTEEDKLENLTVVTDLFHSYFGLVLVAKTKSALEAYRIKGSVKEEWSAVVIGNVSKDETIELNSPLIDSQMALTQIKGVLDAARSKRAQWISLVKLIPVNQRLHRQLEIQCEANDHAILGCANSASNNLFPGKGRFLSLTQLTFVPLGSENSVNVNIAAPEKFSNIVDREMKIWERDVRERSLVELGEHANEENIKRALLGEPIQYILGEVIFCNLKFKVSPSVMIPRVGSEALVNTALKHLSNKSNPRILDLGVGSGCLLLSTLHSLHEQKATGVGIDISPAALDVAVENSTALGLSESSKFIIGDFSKLDLVADLGLFDLVLCNPPYKAKNTVRGLDKGTIDFEPSLALFAGHTGFESYHQVELSLKDSIMKDGGILIVELGPSMENVIKKIFSKWTFLETIKDVNDLTRCLVLQK